MDKTTTQPSEVIEYATDNRGMDVDIGPEAGSSNVDIQRQTSITAELNTISFASSLNLTPYQKHLLLQSWPKVQTYARIHDDAIFSKFCDKSPVGREVFRKLAVVRSFSGNYRPQGALRRHDQLLLQLIGSALENLNADCTPVLAKCAEFGEEHAAIDGMRLTDQVWDQLIEATIECIHMVGYVRKHRELSKVWTMLVTRLVDTMRDGYKRKLVRHKKLVPMRSFESPY